MLIPDFEPYINGVKFTREVKTPYRATQEDFIRWKSLLEKDENASKLLSYLESSSQFFKQEKDLAVAVPLTQRQEMFFSLKNGFLSPRVPAKCIYYIKKIYNKYKMSNLIIPLLPEKEFHVMFSRNYIGGGFTMRDVICTFCDNKFEPITSAATVNHHGEYAEVYIQSTDMVAAIPIRILKELSLSDVDSLEVDTFGIHLNKKYISFLAGYNGACNSIYDLRRLV